MLQVSDLKRLVHIVHIVHKYPAFVPAPRAICQNAFRLVDNVDNLLLGCPTCPQMWRAAVMDKSTLSTTRAP